MKDTDGEKIGYVVSGSYKNMDVYYFPNENDVLIGEIKGAVCQSRFYFYNSCIAFPDGERSAIVTDENGLGYIKNILKYC